MDKSIRIRLLRKIFLILIFIIIIFLLFNLLSKPSVEKNKEEMFLYSNKVIELYNSMNPDINENFIFCDNLSTYKKKINISQKKEYRNGIFIYQLKDDTYLKIYWNKDDQNEIKIEKVVFDYK